MRAIVKQIYIALWIILYGNVGVHPLEIGFVSFSGHAHKVDLPRELNQTESIAKSLKGTVAIPAIVSKHPTHTHEWIPGQVRHHAFIPAHIHHIFVPSLLVARTVEAVRGKAPKMVDYVGHYGPYYGGYGVGSGIGGQGAGHGFQIVFSP